MRRDRDEGVYLMVCGLDCRSGPGGRAPAPGKCGLQRLCPLGGPGGVALGAVLAGPGAGCPNRRPAGAGLGGLPAADGLRSGHPWPAGLAEPGRPAFAPGGAVAGSGAFGNPGPGGAAGVRPVLGWGR